MFQNRSVLPFFLISALPWAPCLILKMSAGEAIGCCLMHACLYVVYVCTCVQCGVGVPMGMWRSEVDFSHPPSLSTSALETGSLSDPGWHFCSWLASQWIPGIYLSLPLLLWKPGSLPDFLHGVEDPPQALVLRRQFIDWEVSLEPLSPTLFVRLCFGDFHLQPGIFGAIDWQKSKRNSKQRELVVEGDFLSCFN